ncbi:cation:proton antiporter [Actinophytocola sp.]|uniref:cation:proton antiporter n=1 Tax=Actinophytocola sp. TaxID=1872138 RepID=UPI002ED37A03
MRFESTTPARRSVVLLLVAVAAVVATGVLVWWFTVEYADPIGALFGTGDLLWWRLLTAVAVIVLAGWVAGYAAERMGQPRVIGEIFVGILLGPTLFGQLAPGPQQFIFAPGLMPYLSGIASVGVALFMLIIGAEVSFGQLRDGQRMVGLVAVSMFAVPVLCGVAAALLLAGHYRPDDVNPLAFVLFVGVAMGVTAFPVLARILRDRGLVGTRLGVLGLVSAGVGDLLAWCLLAVTIAVARGASPLGVLVTIGAAVAFVTAALLLRPWLRGLFQWIESWQGRGRGAVAILLVGLLGLSFAWFTDYIGVHAIFGAFLAGAVLPRGIPVVGSAIRFATALVLAAMPLFFATVGFRINLVVSVSTTDLLVCVLVIVVAAVSKIGATTVAARVGRIAWRDSLALGVMMNCRGLTELVVLSTGLTLGIIGADLFAIFVVMTLVTTTMTAPLLGALRLNGPAVQREPENGVMAG